MPVTSIMQLLHAFFSARGNIVRIDSCTDDSIRISLTVAIRLIGAPVNRYTPSHGLLSDGTNGLSHYLNQCLLLISRVLWHSPENNFTGSGPDTTLYDEFENYIFKNITTSPRDQWVNQVHIWSRISLFTKKCVTVSKSKWNTSEDYFQLKKCYWTHSH